MYRLWSASFFLLILLVGDLSLAFPADDFESGSQLLSNCEQFLDGLIEDGENMQFKPSPGAHQCVGFMLAIQDLSTLEIEGHTLTYQCLPPKLA